MLILGRVKERLLGPLRRDFVTLGRSAENGRFNLIQPVSFQASDPDQLRKTASSHAIEGLALFEHPHEKLGELELVVVGQFRTNEKEVRENVKRILQQGRARLYATNEVDDLIREIRVHGKELDKIGG